MSHGAIHPCSTLLSVAALAVAAGGCGAAVVAVVASMAFLKESTGVLRGERGPHLEFLQ